MLTSCGQSASDGFHATNFGSGLHRPLPFFALKTYRRISNEDFLSPRLGIARSFLALIREDKNHENESQISHFGN